MDPEALRQALETLRAEINHADLSKPRVKAHLNALITDLEVKLEKPNDEEHHASMVERLEEAFQTFKTEHPDATTLVNRILTSLGEAGI